MSQLIIRALQLLVFSGSLLLIRTETQGTTENGNNPNPNHHVRILGPDGNYRLEWLVDWETYQIFFNVTVKTRGFIEFGLSKDEPGTNPDNFVDLIIGGVDVFGKAYFSDRHQVGNGISVADDKQDWILHTASESSTHTFLSFSRPFETGDSQDIPITDATLILIWAYGITDFTEYTPEYQPSTHGSIPAYLLDQDLTPLHFQEGRTKYIPKGNGGTDVNLWTIRTSFKIPEKRTTYWCTIHKKSFPKKNHIIGMIYHVNNETLSTTTTHVHHMFFFRCKLSNASSVFEQYVNNPGEECYNPSQPIGKIPFQHCTEKVAGYAVKGYGLFLPEILGIPVGVTGEAEYFLLQVHYDNPAHRTDLSADVQLDLYHTPKLRQHDGGMFDVAHFIPGSPSLLVPHGSIGQEIHGHCGSPCTTKMFPPTGIKIVSALLHAHNAGKRVTIQHFRGDKELPYILDDENWKFYFQPERLLRNEVTVLPGDKIQMRCFYDAEENRTVVGGYGTDQEMCLTIAYYYNHMEDYSLCWSTILDPVYNAHYLAGTTNLTWDQSRLEFVATAPPSVAGKTVSEISDSPLVNWTPELRKELQEDHLSHPQVEICPTHEELVGHINEKMLMFHG